MKYKRILAAILGALMMFSPTSQLFTYENNNNLIAEAAVSDDTLRLSQKTITLSEANDEQIITFSAISQNDIKFDSVALHIKYDNRLELVPIEYNGTMVGAKPMQEYDDYRALLSGYNELFLLSANNTPIIVTNSGTDLWQFKFKIKDTDSVRNGDKFDIKLEFYDGDFFALKRYGNFVISDIEQGYIAIRDSIVTTTKAATTTTKATTTTTKATTTTTKATTTTTKAATTTTKAATTTTTSNNKFTNGADNWSFSNSRKNFGNTYGHL